MSKHHRKSLPSNIKPLVGAIAACLVLSTPAHAITYIVDNITDASTGSLRAAIILANANAGEDTINFASGLNNSTITLASQIDITDTAPLIIDASTLTNGITISGDNNSRIFGVTENQKLTLNNLTVTAGRTIGHSSAGADCAALGSTFTGGGAICAEGELELIDSTISNNSTAGDIARGGGVFALGTATLTNSTISGNSTTGQNASGGGFYSYSAATLTNSTISSNSTAGIHAHGGGFSARGTTLTNSTVSENNTTGDVSWGGGFSAFGIVTLTNSMVSGNSTVGIRAYGGGFLAARSTMLTNSTVSGNSTNGAGAPGGGFWGRGTTTLTNSTITQNVANNSAADGIYFYTSATTLNSTILSGNGIDNSATSGGTLNATNSLFGDPASKINGTNTDNVFNNTPELAPLADNGCAIPAGAPATASCVQTHALLTTSPALDVGLDNGLPFDQRGDGFPRTIGSQTDIGAFEGFAPVPPVPPVTTPIPTMSAWGLGLLASLLGLMGFVRRRKI